MPLSFNQGVIRCSLRPNRKESINKALERFVTKEKAASVLRVSFHDAFPHDPKTGLGGADGSIRFEFSRPEHIGTDRGLKAITKVHDQLQGGISFADTIYLSGAYAVKITGGPDIPILLGRTDSMKEGPTKVVPTDNITAQGMKEWFTSRGFNSQELVALSGAHTIGIRTFGDPLGFDNSYFRVLVAMPWLDSSVKMYDRIGKTSDRVLMDDPETRFWVQQYAEDQGKFFVDFSEAYQKLSCLGATWAPYTAM